jgi:hypothetical protein
MFLFDSTMLLIIPVLILAIWAQANVKGSYEKYKKVLCSSNKTGATIAEEMLKKNGIFDVPVMLTPGFLSDHYHPGKKEVHLSEEIYHGRSIAAVSIAAHEVGHAIQHARAYYPLVLRGNLLPVANIGSKAAMPLFLIGLIVSIQPLMDIGIILFAGALVFHLVTLPVEFNASSRAMAEISDGYNVHSQELSACRKMLNAAALTYVASTLMTLMQLIRLILLRNSRR